MSEDLLDRTAEIVCAYVGNNHVALSDLPKFIADVHHGVVAAASSSGAAALGTSDSRKPAVNPKRSVFPDHIISLEDGKPHKMLKGHLGRLGMTPEAYRVKWGLPFDYPMTAPNHSRM